MDSTNTNNAPRKPILALLIVVGLGLLSMLPSYIWGIPFGADLDNHFRFAMPFFDELSSGNLFPGWLAESNMGFGDARFRFYPPLIYYLLAAARYVTGEWYAATLAVFSIFSIAGSLGTYVWARQSLSPQVAVTAAAVFALLPYHFAQYYQASLLAEFAAMSLLPFAFLFVARICASLRFSPGDVLGLGVSFGLIVVTHLPSVIVGGLGLGLFSLLSIDWKSSKRSILYAGLGMCLALLFSSFFWVTMMSELSWIQAGHKVTSEYYDYRNNFLFSPFALVNLNGWFGNVVAVLTFGMFLPVVPALGSIVQRTEIEGSNDKLVSHSPFISLRKTLVPAIVIAAATFLMTTELSRPIWSVVPKLRDIQFPFRWLSVASVALCLPVAFAIHTLVRRLMRKELSTWSLTAMFFFVLAVGYSIYELALQSEFLDPTAFNARIHEVRGGPSFPDWLPVTAAALTSVEKMDGDIDPEGRLVLTSQVESHRRRFTLAAGDAVGVRIRSYYYPLWKATVTTAAGTFPAETKPAADGTLLVAVPAESCEVLVQFGN